MEGPEIQSQPATPAVRASAPKEPSNQEINDAFVQQISKQIAGHEQDPSGQVFKNIRVDFLKKVPAGRLLLIMNEGYGRALGVTCKHCHVQDDFSKDDKRPKRCARDMALMHFSINQQLLKMQNLEPPATTGELIPWRSRTDAQNGCHLEDHPGSSPWC